MIEVRGEMVLVKMKRISACSRCGACKPFHGEDEMQIEAINLAQAKLHDRVRVSISPGAFWEALGILYGIPFVALMLGFFVGTYLGGPLLGFAGGLVLLFLCYRIIKATERTRQQKSAHRATVLEVYSDLHSSEEQNSSNIL